jgi:hypothetical protein
VFNNNTVSKGVIHVLNNNTVSNRNQALNTKNCFHRVGDLLPSHLKGITPLSDGARPLKKGYLPKAQWLKPTKDDFIGLAQASKGTVCKEFSDDPVGYYNCLSSKFQTVFGYFVWYPANGVPCYASQERIATYLGMSRSTLNLAVNKLKADGLLTVLNRGHMKNNLYKIAPVFYNHTLIKKLAPLVPVLAALLYISQLFSVTPNEYVCINRTRFNSSPSSITYIRNERTITPVRDKKILEKSGIPREISGETKFALPRVGKVTPSISDWLTKVSHTVVECKRWFREWTKDVRNKDIYLAPNTEELLEEEEKRQQQERWIKRQKKKLLEPTEQRENTEQEKNCCATGPTEADFLIVPDLPQSNTDERIAYRLALRAAKREAVVLHRRALKEWTKQHQKV